ncbi:hypothetical protein BC829DRAFT_281160 [Chytridium lagenaria]|nr:hypothetical protein BC829DRAFT_281160 [Chytridium lagenaria]
MALFDAELVAEYEDGDFLTSPREVLALKETSISSVTSHILYPPITTNLTPISRYVLSSLPTAISKWKLAAAPSIPSLTEQNEKDGRIPFTILQDDRIEIRFLNDSGSSDVITLPIPEDAFPHSRILSWSTDACLVAVGASDGSIRVLHARETGPFVPLFIIEGERSISTGQESLPSTQKHYNPLMNIAIVSFDFRGNSSLLKHSHSHELLAFSYNGSFRVYHIDLPALLGIESLVNNSILTATSSVSFWKKALSLTVQGTLEGLVSFSHSISLSQYFHTITCVSLDLRRRSLLIAGLSGMSLKGHRFARFKGESELQQIIEITLLHDKPFCEVIDAFGNLHPPLESPLRSSTQLEGALASLWDMLGDIGAHALCLVSKKPYINTDKIIINMSASSNTAGDVLALDLSGNIFLLSRVSGSRLNTWRSNDLIVARASLVKQVSVNNVKNPRVIDAKWWSSTSIAITFQTDSYPFLTSAAWRIV